MKYRKEPGIVTDIERDKAVVKVEPGSGVDCSSCCGCSSKGSGEHFMEVDRGKLEAGDRVEVRIPSYSGYTSMILLFGLPMVFFLLGLAGGTYLGDNPWYALAGGGGGLAVSFAVAWGANRLLLSRAPIQVHRVAASEA